MISLTVEPPVENPAAELREYAALRFPLQTPATPAAIPLANELHVKTWHEYRVAAAQDGPFAVLRDKFAILQFPIESGMSKTAVYRAARLRGVEPAQNETGGGIALQEPAALTLFLYAGPAGETPVMSTSCRADFVKLVQSFVHKNEPHPIPASLGACMVSGFNNWDRIHAYRQQWQPEHPYNSWREEFRRISPRKELYQDRFLILCEGPYSGVTAESLHIAPNLWGQMSTQIRLAHESIHYLTKRIYGVMHQHILDELIADYAGIVAAVGHYRADWFLRFMGLENYPDYREGGRLQNYCSYLSAGAFEMLPAVVWQAAHTLQQFDDDFGPTRRDIHGSTRMILAMTRLSLADMAAPDGYKKLAQALSALEDKYRQIGLVSKACPEQTQKRGPISNVYAQQVV